MGTSERLAVEHDGDQELQRRRNELKLPSVE
jgi:hypothetical protein